jgi:hypothetical protein
LILDFRLCRAYDVECHAITRVNLVTI